MTSDPSTATAAINKLPAAMKTVGVTGTVSITATGDTITLAGPAHVDILTYNAASAGNSDQVSNFSGERIEVAAFGFVSTGVTIKAAGTDAAATASGFFASNGVAIVAGSSETVVYIDANKDGSYSAAADIAVHLTGSTVAPADFWF